MNWLRSKFMLLYLSALFAAAPINNTFAKENSKQDDTEHVLQLKDPSGLFYTWTKAIPDTVSQFGEIGIFSKMPSSDAYPDNLAAIVNQLAGADSTNNRWNTTPIPVFYGSNTSSGVSFDSLARVIGQDINAIQVKILSQNRRSLIMVSYSNMPLPLQSICKGILMVHHSLRS